MESVHELVAPPPVRPRADLELVPQRAAVETPITLRCLQCNGLWTVARERSNKRTLCPECRRGNVIPKTQFHNYWLTRFTLDEITEMGRAIWG
jgi:phage FluMu protein Com